ncbi:MAG: DJ-1/PfpI family protein [Deltaproteobacteria bacterium]|nr:DJ-1/PfpI family protein [Deltaproteobacteria bacterium]
MNVGIYIYNEVEVLDFAGPFEVFSTASRVKIRMDTALPDLFNVFTVGEKMAPVLARGGLKIVPRYHISDHPKINLLIIPGGIVSDELEKEHLISWIKESSGAADITASVCTGAFLLGEAGLLQSKAATTHWEDIPDLVSMLPDIQIKRDVRWVDEGNVVTAVGISAGIDMSLHLVSRLDSKNLAVRTAKQMEYDWTRNS